MFDLWRNESGGKATCAVSIAPSHQKLAHDSSEAKHILNLSLYEENNEINVLQSSLTSGWPDMHVSTMSITCSP